MDAGTVVEALFGTENPALRALQILAVFVVAAYSNRVLQRRFAEPQLLTGAPPRLLRRAAAFTRFAIYTTALIVALSLTQLPFTRLFTSLGFVALVAAFVGNQLLANLVAGLVLLLDPHFSVGDRLEMQHIPARVEGPFEVLVIGLRTTRLRTTAGDVVVVPNQWFLVNPYVNRGIAAAPEARPPA